MDEGKSRIQVKILGVRVDGTSVDAVLREIQSKIAKKLKFYIVTPNPEQVLKAQNDELFKEILNSANISVPDGIGLVAAAKFLVLPRPANLISRLFFLLAQGLGVGFSILFDRKWLESELRLIKGRLLFIDIVKLANKKGLKVVLIGDKLHSSQKAVKKLRQNYIHLNIKGITGPDLLDNGKPKTKSDLKIETKAIETINTYKPDLLFIGFGAPKQEKWLYRWYKNMNFRCAMVVGGTFDYISGKRKTNPSWLDDLGLEWLWRILIGNQKVSRVTHAFPEFPLRIYWQKLISES